MSLPAHVREYLAMPRAQQNALLDRALRGPTDYCEACGGDGVVEEGPVSDCPRYVPCEACNGEPQ